MAHGIILTIFQPNPLVINQVNTLLTGFGFPFENRESTFFIQINFTADFDNTVAGLRADGITFTAALLFDTTSSALRTGNISPAETIHISQLLTMP